MGLVCIWVSTYQPTHGQPGFPDAGGGHLEIIHVSARRLSRGQGCSGALRRPPSDRATHRIIQPEPLWDTAFSLGNYFCRSCLSVQKRNRFQHLPSTHDFRLAEHAQPRSDRSAGCDCSYPHCSSFNTSSSHFAPKLGFQRQIKPLNIMILFTDMVLLPDFKTKRHCQIAWPHLLLYHKPAAQM